MDLSNVGLWVGVAMFALIVISRFWPAISGSVSTAVAWATTKSPTVPDRKAARDSADAIFDYFKETKNDQGMELARQIITQLYKG